MDVSLKGPVQNPWTKANIVSKILFWWTIPLIRKGISKKLCVNDLPDSPAAHLSKVGTDKLEKAWNSVQTDSIKSRNAPKFWKALFHVHRWTFASYLIFIAVIQLFIRVMQPIYLGKLVNLFSEDDKHTTATRQNQAICAGVVCACALFQDLLYHQSVFLMLRAGLICRTSISSLLYKKSLRIRSKDRDVGQLLNILSNDLSRFDNHLIFIPYILIGPFQLVILTFILYKEMGVAALACPILILIILPTQALNLHMTSKFRRLVAAQTDARSGLMNEIVMAIRLIKTYAWEKPFSDMISQTRRKEIRQLGKQAYLSGFFKSLYTFSTRFSSFLVIMVYVLLGNELNAEKAFFSVAVTRTIMEVMIFFFSNGISGLGECIASVGRVQKFLFLPEQGGSQENGLDNLAFVAECPPPGNEFDEASGFTRLECVSASWVGSENRILTDLNLDVKGDQLVMVVGAVGSGKTSMLHLLLTEIPIVEGIVACGPASYAAQEPWIFPGNVRQNILFGETFNTKRYDDVVAACVLQDDFEQLPHGDLSIVGERGITLSGGQKARLNLARCLYRKASVYLLDDPLSAVDSRVSRIIFEKGIQGWLKGKLRILVTHQLQYLEHADYVVFLKNGVIHAQGGYRDLINRGVDFTSITASNDYKTGAYFRKGNEVEFDVEEPRNERPKSSKEFTKPEQIMEGTVEGSVNLKTYWGYFKAAKSKCLLVLVILLFLSGQLILSACEYWLSFWTDSENNSTKFGNNGTTSLGLKLLVAEHDLEIYLGRTTYLIVYAALMLALYAFTTAKAIGFFAYTLRISNRLYNSMFNAVVRAPTKFFDDNDSGRIMNRFTKDVGSIDELLPVSVYETLEYTLQLIGVLVIVAMSNYFLVFPSIIVILVFWTLRLFFVKSSRDIRRLESIWKSPVFTHVTASLQGLTTIRAFRSQGLLIEQFHQKQDVHTAAWFAYISISRGFSVWVETIGVLFLTFVTFSFVLFSNESSGGILGLVVTSTLGLTANIQIVTRQSAETENQMTSVERALEYSALASEAPLELIGKDPPKDWPECGAIKFADVFLYYGDVPVLKNLSFEIRANENIGIVGRTGAGKSSIVSALFRLTEPKGSISIDGVLTKDLGLHALRKCISLIPQDPILFSGTMRYNLDPFGQFDDGQLWQALKEVQLECAVSGLDCVVLDGGSNFSVGQRQLLCLARAILRRNKIIVLDEATANVDPKTDEFVQKTIHDKFADCTIIKIAHRLHSVMNCDRVLLMSEGEILEYDHPHILLQNTRGHLSQLVNQTGKLTAESLKQIAKSHFEDAMLEPESTKL